jgi:tRNA-splicing ligase RtcB
MQRIETGRAPILAWVDGVEFEDSARRQVENIARLPIVHSHVAVMPDVHYGIGATVGSVIATKGAIVPAAVGVDIGCGMVAQRTTLRAEQLPDDLGPLRAAIERAIPVGLAMHEHVPAAVETAWANELRTGHDWIRASYPKIDNGKALKQLASLGGGNHYVEVVVDEAGFVWAMLHSGSRGIGNKIGQFFIERARRYIDAKGYGLADRDLSWLEEGTTEFDDYVRALTWAQNYARLNRDLMLGRVLRVLADRVALAGGPSFQMAETAVNCHHNYVARETHFGADVWVTRKGAIRAGAGQLGLIPGSMGARSFVVRGKGNPDSFESCSHGAGRRMGRNQAKRTLTVADLVLQTAGVECRKDAGVLDEAPSAYKSIDDVMAAQTELVDIVHTVKQVVCVKG